MAKDSFILFEQRERGSKDFIFYLNDFNSKQRQHFHHRAAGAEK